jgi:tryptophan halogenase
MKSPGMRQGQIKSIAIAGGGVTGWLAASLLARVLRGSRDIVVIETGDAEPQREFATLPPLTGLHTILGIDENDMLSKTDGTFRLATKFSNWSSVGREYLHPLGETGANLNSIAFRHYWLKLRQSGLSANYSDFNLCAVAAQAGKFARPSADKRSVLSTLEYAYHLDAALYAAYLRDYASKQGARSEQGQIAGLTRNGETGSIETIVLEDSRRFEADLFLDCTGSKAEIIGADAGFEDWSTWLPCDRAIALSTAGGDISIPCSDSVAHQAGWRWRIPLQNRVGHGFVYASEFMSDNDALSTFQKAIGSDASGEPISWKFTNGRRGEIWRGNVIALGAAAATLEPLENINVHIAQIGIARLLALFPDASFAHSEREEYNRLMASELDRIRDFLILHYHAAARSDSAFWNRCRDMAAPDTLTRKLTQFESRGRVVLYDEETFSEDSWTSVFLGQDVIPRRHDPLADNFDTEQLKTQLQRIRSTVRQGADSMPAHAAFIQKYCAAVPSQNRAAP